MRFRVNLRCSSLVFAIAIAVVIFPSTLLAQDQGKSEGDTPNATLTKAVDFFPGFEAFRIKTSAGITIAGVKGGDGPPVLLLHGAPCNLVSWRKVAPALAKKYTVIATDLRGYGENPLNEGVDIVSIWKERAVDVRGHGTPSAHWLPEQISDQVIKEVTAFIDEHEK